MPGDKSDERNVRRRNSSDDAFEERERDGLSCFFFPLVSSPSDGEAFTVYLVVNTFAFAVFSTYAETTSFLSVSKYTYIIKQLIKGDISLS